MRNMIMIKNKKYKTYLYKTLHGSVIYIYIIERNLVTMPASGHIHNSYVHKYMSL